MGNEVTLSAKVQYATPVAHSNVNQQKAIAEKEVKEVEESSRQELTASGKDVPQINSKAKEETDSKVDLNEAIKQIQEHVQHIERDLDFRVDEESGRTVVSVIDTNTDEVVRQIPSEEVLAIIHHLQDGGGLLMNTEA